MSDDNKDATDDEKIRRRRRKSGLRVPSDNVPRKTAPPEAAAEPASDPRLAVSVAYAFSGDSKPANPAEASGAGPAPMAPSAAPTIVEPSADSGDSVDIAFDDDELETIADASAKAEVQTSAAEDLRVPPALAKPEADAEKSEEGGSRRKFWPRVQTETLSDSDLENMIADSSPATASTEDEDDDEEMPTAIEPARLPENFADARPTIEMEAVKPPGAEAHTEASPARPSDASDSGEIIADDMIEEVAERAKGKPGPNDTQEITAAEIEEVRAAAARDLKRPEPAPTAVKFESSKPAAAPAKPAVPAPVKPAPSKPAPAVPAAKPASGEQPSKPPPAPKGGAAAAAAAAASNSRTGKRRRLKPWYEEIFDEDYLRTLPFLTPQSTQFEANFVVESLGVEAGTQILDVGCGYGRHAMELAARGFHVVGLDSSLPLLLRGADEAQRRGLKINFVHGDMREITFESQFDGAYCLFSTFGYFDDETNKKTAQSISKALKPGARFVIEVLNRDYIISDLPSRVWWEGDGCVVLEEVEFNYFSSRILSNRSVVFDDGRQLEQEISIRAYSLHELGKLLHAAGFRVIEVSGSMYARGRYFGGRSRDIVVVAERRPNKSDAPSSPPAGGGPSGLPRATTEPGVG